MTTGHGTRHLRTSIVSRVDGSPSPTLGRKPSERRLTDERMAKAAAALDQHLRKARKK